MNKSIYLAVLTLMILISFPSIHSDSICKKCVDRDFSLYTVGYEFTSSDEIVVRLMNIGDRDYEIGYIEVYLLFPNNESLYIGKYEFNGVLETGKYFEFTFVAPDVDNETDVHLVAFIDFGDKAYSNDFTLKPRAGFSSIIESLESFIAIGIILVTAVLAIKYYYSS